MSDVEMVEADPREKRLHEADSMPLRPVRSGPPLNPSGGMLPDKMDSFGKDTPMGRPGQPNEVAPSYLFLACEDSSYISGQVLHPNGGTVVSG